MITTKEIAKICKVSVATVNRALHDRPDINPKTKEAILQIAAQHGYRPHLMARSLAKGKSMLIGVAVFGIRNPFFPQLISTIQDECKNSGFYIHLGITHNSPEEELECLDMMAGMKVDGIILLPLNQGPDFEDFLEKLHIPVVTICNRISEQYHFVGVREKDAVKDAIHHILKRNYERLIYVSPPLRYNDKRNIYTISERFLGFQEAVNQPNNPPETFVVKEQQYLERIEDILSHGKARTAIICSSDIYAIDVLAFIREKCYKIPEEIGIMGFDNIEFLKYITPSLATVSYPIEKIGKEAVRSLIPLINNEQSPQEVLLETEIIPGASI